MLWFGLLCTGGQNYITVCLHCESNNGGLRLRHRCVCQCFKMRHSPWETRATVQATQEGYQTGLPHSRNKTVLSMSIMLVIPQAQTVLYWFVGLVFVREPFLRAGGGRRRGALPKEQWLPVQLDMALEKQHLDLWERFMLHVTRAEAATQTAVVL